MAAVGVVPAKAIPGNSKQPKSRIAALGIRDEPGPYRGSQGRGLVVSFAPLSKMQDYAVGFASSS